jgi:hypothetical protein
MKQEVIAAIKSPMNLVPFSTDMSSNGHHEQPPVRAAPEDKSLPAAAESRAEVQQQPQPPLIPCKQRPLQLISKDALDALLLANDPPKVFVRGGLLTRLKPLDEGRIVLEALNDFALRGVLARVADWIDPNSKLDGPIEPKVPPPMDVVRDVNNLSEWPGLPTIVGIIECPVSAADGALIDAPGWDPAARLWYQPAPGLTVGTVPERPTPEDVASARELLLTDLLGDFPFADRASKANALTGLDATNWRAELAIRFGVILRKVWGGSRTWAGARA